MQPQREGVYPVGPQSKPQPPAAQEGGAALARGLGRRRVVAW